MAGVGIMVRFPNSKEALNKAIVANASVIEGSPYHSFNHLSGYHVEKDITLDGNGAQTDNLFTVVGIVRIFDLYAYVTEATDSTTLSNVKFETDDGGAQTDLTTTVDGSGAVVGATFIKEKTSTNALTFVNPTAGTILDPVTDKKTFQEVWVFEKTGGVTTYIRISFTGDANTDVDITAAVHYEPITANSLITAV